MSRRIDLREEFEMEALESIRNNNLDMTRRVAIGWLMGRFRLPYAEATLVASHWFQPPEDRA
jgi:hypothetical protein